MNKIKKLFKKYPSEFIFSGTALLVLLVCMLKLFLKFDCKPFIIIIIVLSLPVAGYFQNKKDDDEERIEKEKEIKENS